jgi:NTE family protein
VLSGGGVRAMAFHLGVMRFLAEKQLLERVTRVSTVSGGSLLTGLMLSQTGMKWPRSVDYEAKVFNPLRDHMCGRSLKWAALRQLLRPWNWRFFLSRANLVAAALRGWGVTHTLGNLPSTPEWSINGTTGENGRRFRFKRDTIGDWLFGYASGDAFPLAKAMAVSAAFPGGIGPLAIKTKLFKWKRKERWSANAPELDTVLPFRKMHLYDGGVYDNLGLEPYFDIGTQKPKIGRLAIYVSDAGAPLTVIKTGWALGFRRIRRLADILSEQSRTLRVRSFVGYLKAPAPRGAYVYIASTGSNGADTNFETARTLPTSLDRLTHEEFDAVAGHGYAVAKQSESQFGFVGKRGASSGPAIANPAVGDVAPAP